MNDLLGGQVDLMCDQTTNTTSQIKAEKIKVYGVTTAKRLPSLPNVPTMDEAGVKGFEVSVWHGLYAPKGTPKAVIDKLTHALQVPLKDPTLRQRFADLGAETVAENRATPEALRKYLKAEIDKWAPDHQEGRRLCRLKMFCVNIVIAKRPGIVPAFFLFVTCYTRRDTSGIGKLFILRP